MSSLSLGDLAQSFQIRRDTVRVRQDLARSTQELSSGRKADLGAALSGDFGPLAGIERQIATTRGFATAASEAALLTDRAQLSLGRLHSLGTDLAPKLLSSALTGSLAGERAVAAESSAAFATAVEALNASAAGQGVFGGAATDRPALAAPAQMLADLRATAAGAVSASDVAARVEAWFAPGGGFDTSAYQGSAQQRADLRVAEGMDVALPVKADDPAIRGQLKGLALAALLDGGPLAGTPAEQGRLAELAGEALLNNETALADVRAQVGVAQAQVDAAQTRNSAEASTLEIARSDIVSADPYKVATDLQNQQTQLEMIYTITARLSRLSLTDFLR